ncbi:MAG: tRNA threonylcarbamoyladenosine dehydratase [Betaproteobacteria bacterium]|nr:tRNA threonylcarbamoyladenosine dehydratase [Betaproteobacteria bacterium]
MTHEQFERTAILLGDHALARLAQAHILVAGLGGVGGQCADALARAGIGRLTLVDNDCIAASNINRQLPALHSTVGQAKVKVMRARIADINPACHVETLQVFLTPENMADSLPQGVDYIIDCIDTVPSKVALIATALQRNIPIASSMGAGNRLDATRAKLADISNTHGCGLARQIRTRLRQLDITQGVLTVYSDEPPLPPRPRGDNESRPTNGTISYMPPLFGLMLASAAVRHLIHDGWQA